MSHILLTLSLFIAPLLGGSLDGDTVRLRGIVLNPDGAPVAAAEVVATAVEGGVYVRKVRTTRTDHHGEFVLKLPAGGAVSLSASKPDDYWLASGYWENVLEEPGTAPEIELKGDISEPVAIRLGSRGGKLTIETTDAEGSFWPSVVFINHCHSGSPTSSLWTSTSVPYPTTEHLLPPGEYCVGIVTANRMYLVTPSCETVHIEAGRFSQVELVVDPLELTTEVTRPVEGCSPQSKQIDKGKVMPN